MQAERAWLPVLWILSWEAWIMGSIPRIIFHSMIVSSDIHEQWWKQRFVPCSSPLLAPWTLHSFWHSGLPLNRRDKKSSKTNVASSLVAVAGYGFPFSQPEVERHQTKLSSWTRALTSRVLWDHPHFYLKNEAATTTFCEGSDPISVWSTCTPTRLRSSCCWGFWIPLELREKLAAETIRLGNL